jgi:hypothetical protein
VSEADDLSLLPAAVAAAAVVDANGEIWWPLSRAAEAIDALADVGRVVLGVDLRTYDDDGQFIEVAWSDFRPIGRDDVEHSRQFALASLARPDVKGNAALITWRDNG